MTRALVAVLFAALSAHLLPAQGLPARLDTVLVTSRASSLATPTRSVEVITREELDHRAPRSLGELLAFTLGMDVGSRSAAQADLSLRGSTFDQLLILVDGVRVSDAQSGHYNLDLAVPLASIERIEILRGAGSALYGSDAVGGVINVVTRDGQAHPTAQLHGGSFGAGGAAAAGGGEIGAFHLLGSAELDRSDGHRSGTEYRIAQVRGSLQRATSAGRLIADAAQGVRDFGAADFYSPYPSVETTRTTTAALRLVPTTSGRVAVSAALHARRHSDLFTLKRDDPTFYQNAHLSWQSGAETSVRTAITPLLAAAVGGELFDARLRSVRLGDHDERRIGAFAEVTAGRPAGATLDAGVRADRSTTVSTQASPFLGVSLPLGSRAQLRASAGRGFRAPTWTERYYRDPGNVADSTLGAEHFWSGESGVRVAPVSWLSADVAYFERRATSLIDWARPAGSPATTPWRTRNFADATFRGVEARVDMRELLGVDWTLSGSGLRFDSSAEPGTEGKYALRPITRSLGVQAVAPTGTGGRLTMNLLHARRAREDGHLRLDARLAQPLAGVWCSIELVNLTSSSYLDASAKPVAPRSVFLGIGWPGAATTFRSRS